MMTMRRMGEEMVQRKTRKALKTRIV